MFSLVFYNNDITKTNGIFSIIPAKNRDNHSDCYTHLKALGIIITTEKPSNRTVSV